MPKKRVDTGPEGFSPVVENNTPENEISCVKSCVGVDEKLCGGGESNSGQKRLVPVENKTSEKEIFAVSGGVEQNKIASNPVEKQGVSDFKISRFQRLFSDK